MMEGSRRSNCDDCFESRISLDSLARRYVAGDHWLKDPENRMAGDYSLEAIHAIGRRINIDRSPRDVRGPFLKDDPDIDGDENLLFEIKSQIAKGAFSSDHIRILQQIALRGQQSFNNFLNLGKRHWDLEAEKAKPFLDQLGNRDPTEPQAKREIFQRVYFLDQGPFILAKTALGRCNGPWFRMCAYGEKFQRFHIPRQPVG